MNVIEKIIQGYWEEASEAGDSYFPHEYLYRMIRDGELDDDHDIDPVNCWMIAACEKNLPIYVPGWGDSTLGNVFASLVFKGKLDPHCVKSDIEYMVELAHWYLENSKEEGMKWLRVVYQRNGPSNVGIPLAHLGQFVMFEQFAGEAGDIPDLGSEKKRR